MARWLKFHTGARITDQKSQASFALIAEPALMPILLLDEPTASLDTRNRAVVIDPIREKKRDGAAIIAIVHDEEARAAIADAVLDVAQFSAAASLTEGQIRV